ncbi:hypothetical protein ES707_05718 [subsurface metagenome]
MRTILKVIDSINQRIGTSAAWLCLVLVLVGTYDAIMRYAFNAPTVWAYETSCMLGGTIYVMGWAYDHLRKSHVRVDIFYARFSPRGKAIIDVIAAAIFFFPLMAILVKTSISWMLRAYAMDEVMKYTYWYPPATPYRTIFVVGICLFALQGLAQFIRDLYFAIRNKALD